MGAKDGAIFRMTVPVTCKNMHRVSVVADGANGRGTKWEIFR